MHAPKGIDTPLIVLLHTGLTLFVEGSTVGVIQRGVVCNTDQTSALSSGQMLQFLAKIGGRSSFNTVTALTKEDDIEIVLHDNVLVVPFFQLCGAEDLQNLTLNSHIICLEIVFDQLLGDGRTTELIPGTYEHIDTGFDGREPVNTLMFKETVILDSNSSMDQVLGDIFIIHPLLLHVRIDLLQGLDITVRIQIISIGCLIQNDGVQIRVGIGQNIILQVVAKGTDKYHHADTGDQQNRNQCAQRNLQNGVGRGPQAPKDHKWAARPPVLSGYLSFPSVIVISHS